MKHILKIWGMILITVMCLPVSAALPQQEEYAIKAVYLERLTRFIKWPASSDIADRSESFIIRVLGKNPFGSLLEEIYSSRNIQNKTVRLLRGDVAESIAGCHLVFIPKSEEKNLPEILALTKDRPVLTVGDTQGFSEKGVIVNFYLDDNKVRFEINETAARAAGLSISYKLLRLAKIVSPLEER